MQVVRNRVAWEAARLNCATVALGVLPPLSVTPGMMDAARYALVENLLDAELDRPRTAGAGASRPRPASARPASAGAGVWAPPSDPRAWTSYISTQLRTYDREGVRFFEVGGDDGDGLFRRGTAAREQVVK